MPVETPGRNWRSRLSRILLYGFTFALALIWATPMACTRA